MSTQIVETVSSAANEEIVRRSANYHPSVWGDYFISYSSDCETIKTWCHEADSLKEQVREMLISEKPLSEQLNLIDVIQRLGIAYHFEGEIKEAVKQIFNQDVDCNLLLHTSTLRFRLLREFGYNVPCDIFKKFKDDNGSFNEDITKDVSSLLSLYEAAHLRVHGEVILDEALTFCTSNLESMVSSLNPSLAKQVFHTLKHPIRKAMTRLEAQEFLSFYEENKLHNAILLKFAKLDFNIVQKQQQKELSFISKWWENLEFSRKLPFARDRLVECYFWAVGVFYEPQYALARKLFTKLIAILTIIDDIYDAYGTKEELELFTKALERWETRAMDKLPEYMKITYQTLLQVFDEMEEVMAKEGRSYAVCFTKQAMKILAKAYHEESKWLNNNKVPTMEEYMKVALVTTTYHVLSAISFAGMGEIATEESFNWLLCEPPILHAICVICRLMDDIVSHEFEQQRKHIPSAVECYMNQYKVSKTEAYEELNKQIRNAWKDINQAFVTPGNPPMPLLMRLLNFCRVMDVLYTDRDDYTHADTKAKHYITSLFIDPVKI